MSDEPRVIADLARELQALPPLSLDLSPVTAFHLTGIVQLALRHPQLPPASRAAAERFVEVVRAHCASAPTVLDVLRQGADPRFDR